MKQKALTLTGYALLVGVINIALVLTTQTSTVSAVQPATCESLGGQDKEDCIKANTPDPECTGDDCCGDVKTSIIKNDKICGASDKEGGMIFAILKEVLKFLTAGVGIAAVGGIGYGALLYTTAESKPEQTKKAIGIITNVVIGIAAYALMYVFLNFLIPGGIFS